MTPEVRSVSLGRPAKRPRLRDRLVLRDWVNHQLGFPTQQALVDFLRPVTVTDEFRFGSSCTAFVRRILRSPDRQALLRRDDLVRYDRNIRRQVREIDGRREWGKLPWFQRLAALYTEIVLDLRFRRPATLATSLNAFVQSREYETLPGRRPIEYRADDPRKMVFWMDYESDRTLLLHLNFRQYLHYCGYRTPDNILLVTPDEGSSERHRAHLAASRIPTRRYDEPRPLGSRGHRVGIIEITKLAPRRRGYGRIIPVDAFEGKNLVFVDQADRGCFGEKRRALLDELAETGFTFEYGASFGSTRAITSNPDRADACSREILFHHPREQFHADGFGKDFRITALR